MSLRKQMRTILFRSKACVHTAVERQRAVAVFNYMRCTHLMAIVSSRCATMSAAGAVCRHTNAQSASTNTCGIADVHVNNCYWCLLAACVWGCWQRSSSEKCESYNNALHVAGAAPVHRYRARCIFQSSAPISTTSPACTMVAQAAAVCK